METLGQKRLSFVLSLNFYRRRAATVPSGVAGIHDGPTSPTSRSAVFWDVWMLASFKSCVVAKSMGLLGAPRRPARFDVVILRLYRASRRRRVDDRVATRRVLLRRKHRLLPRTPVHKRGPRLPRQRPGPNLTGMARGRARGKRGVLCETPQRGAHIKRVIKRRKRPARGRRKRSTSCGRVRGSAFVSSVRPSDGHKRTVGRKTSVRCSRRYRSQSSKKRHGSSHWEPDPTRAPSGGRNSDAQHGKEVTRVDNSKRIDLPTFRRKRMRLSSAPRSCLSGKLASKHEGATGVRPVRKTQVVCDSRSKDLAPSDVPEGSHVEAQGQNNGRTVGERCHLQRVGLPARNRSVRVSCRAATK